MFIHNKIIKESHPNNRYMLVDNEWHILCNKVERALSIMLHNVTNISHTDNVVKYDCHTRFIPTQTITVFNRPEISEFNNYNHYITFKFKTQYFVVTDHTIIAVQSLPSDIYSLIISAYKRTVN